MLQFQKSMSRGIPGRICCRLALAVLCFCATIHLLHAASPAQQQPEAQASQNTPELATHEQPTTFKVNVRLVLVRAVVRDALGKAVGNLKKEDFELLDNHKPQVISHFSVEQAGAPTSTLSEPSAPGSQPQPTPQKKPVLPQRYVAYVFDDIHLKFADVVPVRTAAEHHLASLPPDEEAAIFTTSGQGNVDFTNDHAKLREGLYRIMPRPTLSTDTHDCPDIGYYLADRMVNDRDDTATQIVVQEVLTCYFSGDPRLRESAERLADGVARRIARTGDAETQMSLKTLEDVARRMAAMPGQRAVVLVSPGIYTGNRLQGQNEVIDRALNSNVIISTLDARGLYTTAPDMNESTGSSAQFFVMKSRLDREEALAKEEVLAELANATGGTFFHNSNDLEAGFNRIAGTPEYIYVLGFSPQNMKYDGRFHSLQVRVKGPQRYDIQARSGYYAPRGPEDATETAKQEIEDAVFSQEETKELPVEVHTRFFKSSDTDATLTVLAHVDVKQVHYQKVDGRNRNDLTLVVALFDQTGKYVVGDEKVLNMRLRDDTLENKLDEGITLKSNFKVKPGVYQVRLVVRDDEGHLAARNGIAEIP